MIRPLAILSIAGLAGGCGTPPAIVQTDSGAMSLLRTGSAKVCTAGEVKESLKNLIVPKVASLGDYDLPVEDKAAAVGGVTVKLSYTTLEAFDKSVSKVTCNATISLERNGSDLGNGSSVTYSVSPSADDENSFVITAGVSDLREAARSAIIATLDEQVQSRAVETQNAQAAAEQAILSRTVSNKWLVGRWIGARSSVGDCVDGPYHEYQSDGQYVGYEAMGRWSLSGTELTVTGEAEGEPFSTTTKITAADRDGFTEQDDAGPAAALRRCAQSELDSPKADDEQTY